MGLAWADASLAEERTKRAAGNIHVRRIDNLLAVRSPDTQQV
jgi:hypothetical protein